jgi:drug/metabolite transporter (DMT)-like permease
LTTTRTALLTALTMLAFAANAVLCRLALHNGAIDPASFSSVRVVSGALMLALLAWPHWRRSGLPRADWRSAAALFSYMICFSVAYLWLQVGTGTLILFVAVQLTMFVVALRRGEHFSALSWLGLGLAVLGLVYLVAPGVTAPDPLGAGLMAAAGVAWGVYTLRGQAVTDPLAATASNFLFAVPLVLAVSVPFIGRLHAAWPGVALAVASGAIASGLGYALWYSALPGLKATSAATVQLSVPVIAAFGGVLLLAEPVTLRLVLASAATLGGVAIVLRRRAARG